jgi:hypothetical protein
VPVWWTWDAEPGTVEGEAMNDLQVAIYVRVSSEQQAEARTIASQWRLCAPGSLMTA